MSMGYVGFAKLRPGRIHVFCPGCKRKVSNLPRSVGYNTPDDPLTAVLAHIYCDKCSAGCKDTPMTFLDARGRELCGYCGERCDKVGTRKHCTERLVNEAVARSLAAMKLPAPPAPPAKECE